MSKKAFITIIAALFTAVSCCFAQQETTTPPEYVDGVLSIKLIDSYPLDFKVNDDRTINIDEIALLKKCERKFKITSVRQEFYLNNDPKLLRTLTISFENTDMTDKLIEKLQKNKKVEFVERVGIKKMMMKKTAAPLLQQPKN